MKIKRAPVQPPAKKALSALPQRRVPRLPPNYGDWHKNKSNIFPDRVANLRWVGNSLQSKAEGMARQFFSLPAVKNQYPSYPGINKVVCLFKAIIDAESTWNPDSVGSYVEDGVTYHVHGLFQISDIHSDMAQWPTRNGLPFETIYNPEYNVRLALTMMNSEVNAFQNPFADEWESTYDEAKTVCGVS